MYKLKQVIEKIKEYEDNNCFELKTSVVLHWLNEIQNEAINYSRCCKSDSELFTPNDVKLPKENKPISMHTDSKKPLTKKV